MSCPVRDFLPHSADAIARALKARNIWRVSVVRCVAAARGLRVPDDARRLWHVHARDRSQHPVGIAFEQAHVVAREVGDGQKAPVGRQREVPRPLPSGRNVAAPRNPSLAVHREDDQLVASAHRRVQLPPVGRDISARLLRSSPFSSQTRSLFSAAPEAADWKQDAHFAAGVIANSLEGALLHVSLVTGLAHPGLAFVIVRNRVL